MRLPLDSHLTGAWSGLCGLLAALCIGVWLLPVEWQIALRWDAQTWSDAPWTCWSASLTHLSDTHLLVNVLALLCLAIIGAHTGCGRAEALAVLMAWPLSTGLLLMWPQVQFYAGFSGLNHALALVIIAQSAIHLIVKREFSAIAFLLALMLMSKMIWEQGWQVPLRPDLSWGFVVVQAAHVTGVLAAGMAVALVYTARIFCTKEVVE
jgi:rhomboid family GlyGly-CTERM serine protease